jgi:hypothetical protein
VHKRAETYSTAMELIELISTKFKNALNLFEAENSWKR